MAEKWVLSIESGSAWPAFQILEHAGNRILQRVAKVTSKKDRPPKATLCWVPVNNYTCSCYIDSAENWVIELSPLLVARIHAYFNLSITPPGLTATEAEARVRKGWIDIQEIIDSARTEYDKAIASLMSYGDRDPNEPSLNRSALIAIFFLIAHEIGHLSSGHPQWLRSRGLTAKISDNFDYSSNVGISFEESLSLELLADLAAVEIIWEWCFFGNLGGLFDGGSIRDTKEKNARLFGLVKGSIVSLFVLLNNWFANQSSNHPEAWVRSQFFCRACDALQMLLCSNLNRASADMAVHFARALVLRGGFLDEGDNLFSYFDISTDETVSFLLEFDPAIRKQHEFLNGLWKILDKTQEECSLLAPQPTMLRLHKNNKGFGTVATLTSEGFLRMIELMNFADEIDENGLRM